MKTNETSYLFTLVLKSPNGEWPITYTFTHIYISLLWLIKKWSRNNENAFYVVSALRHCLLNFIVF